MSTQRRENRWQRTSCTESGIPGDRSSSQGWKRGVPTRRFLPGGVQCAGPPGETFPGPVARHACANASGGTAPPGIPARLATNSLQSGYRFVKLVGLVRLVRIVRIAKLVRLVRLAQIARLVRQDKLSGSPPFAAGRSRATGTPANHGSSLPHIPSPSGLAPLYPTLPRVPAGRRRRAERYDGKRDLHLQHAA